MQNSKTSKWLLISTAGDIGERLYQPVYSSCYPFRRLTVCRKNVRVKSIYQVIPSQISGKNELILVPPIQNINSFSNMVDNRLTICRFTLTLNIVSGKDSEPTDCNPVWQGKEFPPDHSHWFACSLKNKCDYLLILALAFVTINVNSTYNLIQFKDLNILILRVSYCTKFDDGWDILPILFTGMQICHEEDTLWEQRFWLLVFITLFLNAVNTFFLQISEMMFISQSDHSLRK